MDPVIKGLLISAAKELPFLGIALAYFRYMLRRKKKDTYSIKELLGVLKRKEFSKVVDKWEIMFMLFMIGAYLLSCLVTWERMDYRAIGLIFGFSVVLALFGIFTVSDAVLTITAGMIGAYACHGMFFTGKINLGIVGGTIGIASFVYLPKYLKMVAIAKKNKWAGIKTKMFYSISPYLPAGFIVSTVYYFLSQF